MLGRGAPGLPSTDSPASPDLLSLGAPYVTKLTWARRPLPQGPVPWTHRHTHPRRPSHPFLFPSTGPRATRVQPRAGQEGTGLSGEVRPAGRWQKPQLPRLSGPQGLGGWSRRRKTPSGSQQTAQTPSVLQGLAEAGLEARWVGQGLHPVLPGIHGLVSCLAPTVRHNHCPDRSYCHHQ